MSKLQEWRDAKKANQRSTEYVSLIGKKTDSSTLARREGVSATAGKLSEVKVGTKIHFQPYDGATNYHVCHEFDEVLADVIKGHFKELSKEALALLDSRVDAAAIEAEAEVDGMKAEISEAKNTTQVP